MDLYLLSSDFKTLGIIDDFNSLIWQRKYYTVGEYELYLPDKYYTAIRSAAYLYRNNRPETGVLEAFDVDNGVLTVKGRFLESLLADDIIFPVQSFTNKTSGEIANTLVSDLKGYSVTATDLGNSVTAQVTGDNLMDYTYSLLQTDELSQRITYDFKQDKLAYTVYQGVDRRQSQSVNSWAVFSPDWESLRSCTYSYSNKDYKNCAVVAGAGEGTERKYVTVDLSASGERKRKIFVDARDLQQGELTDDAYSAVLMQRGLQKLSKYVAVQKFDATAEPNALKYMTDYDLGDYCTVQYPSLGITSDRRLTEIEEVYENGALSLSLQFGDGFLSVKDYVKRELT